MQVPDSQHPEVKYPASTIAGPARPHRSFGAYDLESLATDTKLTGVAVTILFDFAARRLEDRTGLHVRVIDNLFWDIHVQGLSEEAPGPDPPLCGQVARGFKHNLRSWQIGSADIILIVWGIGQHWSTLILCHPGMLLRHHAMLCQGNTSTRMCQFTSVSEQVGYPGKRAHLLSLSTSIP